LRGLEELRKLRGLEELRKLRGLEELEDIAARAESETLRNLSVYYNNTVAGKNKKIQKATDLTDLIKTIDNNFGEFAILLRKELESGLSDSSVESLDKNKRQALQKMW